MYYFCLKKIQAILSLPLNERVEVLSGFLSGEVAGIDDLIPRTELFERHAGEAKATPVSHAWSIFSPRN